MGFQMFGAVAGIETLCNLIGGLHIDADVKGFMPDEPFRQSPQQLWGHPAAPVLLPDRDPLQFSVTTKAASEMAGDQADNAFTLHTNK
jgi:hypothetical protein